jgi:signal transduction histidine kinase/ligand-binding sensor domain-containing protein
MRLESAEQARAEPRGRSQAATPRDAAPWRAAILATTLAAVASHSPSLIAAESARADPASAPKRLRHFVLESWGRASGLPSNQVDRILKGPDGYLWISTGSGLVRFDGRRFSTFSMSNTPAFATDDVGPLVGGPDGSLWIGTLGGGLVRHRLGRFSRLAVGATAGSAWVEALAMGGDGSLWIGTRGGLFRIHPGGTEPSLVPAASSLEVSAVLAEPDGGVIVGTRGSGVLRLQLASGELQLLASRPTAGTVTALLRDRRGDLWIGIEGSQAGLLRWVERAFRPVPGLADTAIVGLQEDGAGNVWVGTTEGVTRFSPSGLESFGAADGLPDGRVRTLYCGDDGVWVGTYGGGMARLRDGPITAFTTADGLSAAHARAVFEARDGAFWIGTYGGGLTRLRDGVATAFSPERGFPARVAWSITQTHDGTIWVGTDEGLMASPSGDFSSGRFRRYTVAQGLASNQVRIVLQEPAEPGALWLGMIGGGVDYFRNGALVSHFDRRSGLAADDIRFLAKASAEPGDLWIGTNLGLNRLRGGHISLLTTADGLSGNIMRAIHVDAAGDVWVGTSGAGLNRIRDGRITAFDTRDGLPSNDIWAIVEDEQGRLWLSGDWGLARVSREDIAAYEAKQAPQLSVTRFDIEDGMRTTEFNAGGHPAGLRAADGSLWFPTMRGPVRVDAAAPTPPAPPPVVEALVANGQPVEGAVVPRGRRDIEIRYTALAFVKPEDVRLRYRLSGYDESWTPAGDRRAAFYTRLPPGEYHFEVAAGRLGSGPERTAKLSFRLEPHLWETAWFLALASVVGACCVGGAGYVVHRVRTRMIRARTAALLAEVRQRERAEMALAETVSELEERNRELERFNYTVSHDLKAPLVTIQNFLGLVEKGVAEGKPDQVAADIDRVRRAAQWMQRLLGELLELSRVGRASRPSEDVPFSELVRDATAAVAGRLASRGVEVVSASDLPVVRGDPVQLREALQNLLDNAAKFMGGQPTPRIEIGTRGSGPETVFFVKDNGMGVEPRHHELVFGLFDKLDPATEGTGLGLALVRRIVEAHGGRIWLESAGAGMGSAFCFTLPLAPEGSGGAPPTSC